MNRTDTGPTVDIETIEISDPTRLPTKPLVSIYMLAYRHERFIARAIDGVIGQHCDFPIELIIGEDCSPDSTRKIVLEYQKRYPKVIRVLTASKNVGLHANVERCLRATRGQYVAICEGDDFWHDRRKLEMQVSAFLGDESVTLCHTEYDRQLRFGTKHNCHGAAHSRHIAHGMAYEALLHEWTVMTATAMYRADILRAFQVSPFRVKRWPFGDYNKALYAAANGRIVYLPVSTATWRKVAGSASNSSVEAYLNMTLAHAECRELFLANYPVRDSVALSVRTDSKREIMNRAFWAGRKDLFEECETWLIDHGRNPPVQWLRLKKLVLGNRLLTRGSQHFRTVVRSIRLIGR